MSILTQAKAGLTTVMEFGEFSMVSTMKYPVLSKICRIGVKSLATDKPPIHTFQLLTTNFTQSHSN